MMLLAEIVCVSVFVLGTVWILWHGAGVAVPAATALWLVVFACGAYGQDRFLTPDEMGTWVLFGWVACVVYYGIVALMRGVVLKAAAREHIR